MDRRLLEETCSSKEVIGNAVYVYRNNFREYLTPSYQNVMILCDVIASALYAQSSKQPRRR